MCLPLFSSQLPPSPGSVTTREAEILVSLAQSAQCWLWHDGDLEGLPLGPARLSLCPLPLGPPLTFFLLDGTSTQECRHLGSTLWLAQGYVRWEGWLGLVDLRRSLGREPRRQTAAAQGPGVVGSCRGWRQSHFLPWATSLAMLLASLGAVCTLTATLQDEGQVSLNIKDLSPAGRDKVRVAD